LLLCVFPAEHLFLAVEEIKKLPAVDFIEGEVQLEVLILIEQVDHIVRREQIQPWDRVIGGAHHGEGLPRASLTVSETCRFGALEGLDHEGEDAFLVNVVVILVTVKGIVECKVMLLDELSQVNLGPNDTDTQIVS
jgi:hypothetical protein